LAPGQNDQYCETLHRMSKVSHGDG
jgi:hypothetical protein